MITNVLFVALGSATGGVLRYGISLLSRSFPHPFPYWTFLVNVVGSLLIGFLASSLPTDSEKLRLLLVTGFCGGFTTFSAFSLETLELFQQNAIGWGVANVGLNVLCAVGGCLIGYMIAR
ncbi:MAG: fluoride efflux transporter CrcB [Ignavibacteriae bacterium]|nr:fluoride efflux transporter CrcB [Ignavibacteriota bacterium]MCB9215471.1 fluoride efflux transporter CrcB [Ignavibacteria bacterium]